MCGGGSVIGAAAVDKEADMVDEPFGGSSTEVASCETGVADPKNRPATSEARSVSRDFSAGIFRRYFCPSPVKYCVISRS